MLKKEALAQVFSCEFCEMFKNVLVTEQLWTISSMFFNPFQGNVPFLYPLETSEIEMEEIYRNEALT